MKQSFQVEVWTIIFCDILRQNVVVDEREKTIRKLTWWKKSPLSPASLPGDGISVDDAKSFM